MRPARLRAPDIGIQAVDPVDQPLAAQEVESPIDRRRRHAARVSAKLLEELVGADWRVAAPDQLQDLRAQRA